MFPSIDLAGRAAVSVDAQRAICLRAQARASDSIMPVRSLAIDILRILQRGGPQDAASLAAACGSRPAEARSAAARLVSDGRLLLTGNAYSLSGNAYPLGGFDFLDAAAIRAALRGSARGMAVDVVDSCESTNSTLLDEADLDAPRLLLAEEQTAGRGRRGRRWLSGIGDALTLSLRRAVARPLRDLPALSLVSGVAASRALHALGAPSVRLKWPNDLVVTDASAAKAKLGGILVETRQQGSRVTIVVGIGINVRESRRVRSSLARRVASLEQLVARMPSRNTLAAALASELCLALDAFEREGFGAVQRDWEALHAYAGERLRVRLANGRVLAGTADGVDEQGALRLRTRGGVHAVHSGRVVNARAA
jgi:BirA family biotin operon repressor/biotin-[acetyl-CoA-carboxylase] ligase